MPIKRCGTCRHWSKHEGPDHVGACGLVNQTIVTLTVLTTDMTVCSKWDWRQEEAQARTVPDDAD